MRDFAHLCVALEATPHAARKRALLADYLHGASPQDAAWSVFLLTGRRLPWHCKAAELRDIALAGAGIPKWLFAASHRVCGDLAETVALVIPGTGHAHAGLGDWLNQRLAPALHLETVGREAALVDIFRELDREGRIVLGKLLLRRVPAKVSPSLVHGVLGEIAHVPASDIAQRLARSWRPGARFWDDLRGLVANSDPVPHRPYAFCLPQILQGVPQALGLPARWHCEWQWDGERAQIMVRAQAVSIWSTAGELMNERFPELAMAALRVPPGTTLDGVIVGWNAQRDQPVALPAAAHRQARRASTTGRRMSGIVLIAFDLLELNGADIRASPFAVRRAALEDLIGAGGTIRASVPIESRTWADVVSAHASCHRAAAIGLMLKDRHSTYAEGPAPGTWWAWPAEPHSVTAVLVYAQPGRGRLASRYAEYTFAVRDGPALVPFARAEAGLSDAQVEELDAWIRSHTLEKFGPVRSVVPIQLFELAFDGIAASPRHKSGVMVRSARIVRWRKEAAIGQADSLDVLKTLAAGGQAPERNAFEKPEEPRG